MSYMRLAKIVLVCLVKYPSLWYLLRDSMDGVHRSFLIFSASACVSSQTTEPLLPN